MFATTAVVRRVVTLARRLAVVVDHSRVIDAFPGVRVVLVVVVVWTNGVAANGPIAVNLVVVRVLEIGPLGMVIMGVGVVVPVTVRGVLVISVLHSGCG